MKIAPRYQPGFVAAPADPIRVHFYIYSKFNIEKLILCKYCMYLPCGKGIFCLFCKNPCILNPVPITNKLTLQIHRITFCID